MQKVLKIIKPEVGLLWKSKIQSELERPKFKMVCTFYVIIGIIFGMLLVSVDTKVLAKPGK